MGEFYLYRLGKNYPIEMIKSVVIILLLASSILIILIFVKRRKSLKKMAYFMLVGMIALTAFTIGFILTNSFATIRAYYLMSIMFAVTAFLQVIKAYGGIVVCNNKE